MSGLPTGWVEVELGEVWHESRARARPDAITQTDYIGLEHVGSGTNRILAMGRSGDVKSAVAVFSVGDVLYGRLRPYLNKVIRPGFAGVASTEFLVFKETQTLANALLMHLLSSIDLVGYASANSAGVNLPRVSAKRLAKYRFPLAPLPEQHRIVAKIESLFAKLDEGVAALKRAEANLERYRASVLKSAVEGSLTEQWRRENPPTETGEDLLQRILTERRKRWEEEQLAKFEAKGRKPPRNWKTKYKEPAAPDTDTLPELPEGWCWATVDQVSAVTGGLTKNPARNRLPIRYPYLRVANVYADEIRLDDVRTIGVSESELDRVLLRPGDLLVVEGNGSANQIGRVARWQGDLELCCHQNHLIKVRCAGSACRSRWMLLWLLSPLGRRTVLAVASSTSGLHTLSSVIHHSDQGTQYTSIAFGKRCRQLGVRPSTGSARDCYDNALAESFFATLETELLWRERFKSQAEARMAVFEFIEGFYNPRRRHSALDNVSPIVYERRYSETRSSAVETAVSMQIASRSAQPLGSRSAAPTGSHRITATTSNPSVQLSTETG